MSLLIYRFTAIFLICLFPARIAVNLQRDFGDKKISISQLETGEEKEEKKSEKDDVKEKFEAVQQIVASRYQTSLFSKFDFFDITFTHLLPIHFFAVPTPPP
ncbi:MAG: hypothetical protein EOP46_10000 [Sphingobacteriaceae bacterium]|nr:MAG: hypothetical protein EOP46_10000 [Sphingobacteriaceae bacterium]